MALTLVLFSSVIFLSVLSIYLLARDWSRRDRQIADLQKQVTDLQKANCQRLPYKSFEELLDAMIALDKEITERKFQIDLLENAKGHIANAMAAGTKREK